MEKKEFFEEIQEDTNDHQSLILPSHFYIFQIRIYSLNQCENVSMQDPSIFFAFFALILGLD